MNGRTSQYGLFLRNEVEQLIDNQEDLGVLGTSELVVSCLGLSGGWLPVAIAHKASIFQVDANDEELI